jgi:hypothetical protein
MIDIGPLRRLLPRKVSPYLHFYENLYNSDVQQLGGGIFTRAVGLADVTAR